MILPVTDASPPTSVAARPPSVSHRLLNLAGQVTPDETRDVLLMSSTIFLLLVAYYVLKTVREPLVLATGGAELKSYAAGAQAAVLLAYVPLYGHVARRLPVQVLVTRVNLVFIACIEAFFLAGRAGLPYVGFAFYVFIGIFSLTLIAQFWSFANDIYRKSEGDRLFPIIAIGATAGAPLGAAIAGELFAFGVGPFTMMQLAVALLLLHTWLYGRVRRRSQNPGSRPTARAATANGFAMVLSSPYLRLIALLLVMLNIVNTTGEYILAHLVTERADALAAGNASLNKAAFIGQFYGSYFFWVNIASVTLQALAVSRIVKYLGMAGVLFTLPIVALGAYGLIMSGAALSLVRWVKTAENASDYSVMNTAKQMLWLPTSREEKYAAKQAVDTFFVRCGDMLSAGVVLLGAGWLSLSASQFAATNIAFIAVALVVAALLLREYRRVTAEPAAEAAAASAAGPGRAQAVQR